MTATITDLFRAPSPDPARGLQPAGSPPDARRAFADELDAKRPRDETPDAAPPTPADDPDAEPADASLTANGESDATPATEHTMDEQPVTPPPPDAPDEAVAIDAAALTTTPPTKTPAQAAAVVPVAPPTKPAPTAKATAATPAADATPFNAAPTDAAPTTTQAPASATVPPTAAPAATPVAPVIPTDPNADDAPKPAAPSAQAAAPTPAATAAPINGSPAAAPAPVEPPTPAPAAATTHATPQPITTDNAGDDLNAARVARGLRSAVAQNNGSVTLRLTPPDLGTVRIDLKIEHAAVRATLTAETDSARTLLNQQLGTLRKSLESQGFSVERLGVQSATNTNASNQPDAQAHRDGRGQQQHQQPQHQQRDQRGGDAQSFASWFNKPSNASSNDTTQGAPR